MPGIPDLTTDDGKAVAQDMLLEAGWPRVEIDLDTLLRLCGAEACHEFACRFLERIADRWPDDEDADWHPRKAIDAKRAWRRGELDREALRELDNGPLAARAREQLATHGPMSVANALGWATTWVADRLPVNAAREVARAVADVASVSADETEIDRDSARHRAERGAQLQLIVAHMLEHGPPEQAEV